jgi:hypothetical protein
MIVNINARLGLLLVTAVALGPIGAQNQTPANMAPPAWLRAVWKDPNAGLMWALRDNGSDISQTGALNYCRNLSLGGLRDWRLPEIDELAQIYDASVVSGSGTYNGNRYDLHVKGGIEMTGICGWSATRGNRSGGHGSSTSNLGTGTPAVWATPTAGGHYVCVVPENDGQHRTGRPCRWAAQQPVGGF